MTKQIDLNFELTKYFLKENVWRLNLESMANHCGTNNLKNLQEKFGSAKLDWGMKNSQDGEHWLEVNFKTGEIVWQCVIATLGQKNFEQVINEFDKGVMNLINGKEF